MTEAWRKVGVTTIQQFRPVWPSGTIGSLVMSDGTLTFPPGTALRLLSRMTLQDVENTLDTATAAGRYSGGPYDPLFLFTVAEVCRESSMSPSSHRRDGWWKPLLEYPNLCDALLECARTKGTPEFEMAHLHYETLRRLICAEEPRLRLLPV